MLWNAHDSCYDKNFKERCIYDYYLPLTCYWTSILSCEQIEKDFRLKLFNISYSKGFEKAIKNCSKDENEYLEISIQQDVDIENIDDSLDKLYSCIDDQFDDIYEKMKQDYHRIKQKSFKDGKMY